MEEDVMEDGEEIDTIITELEISKGTGNLILCVVNSPAYRDRIIRILRGRFSSKVIYIDNGEQLIRTLKEHDFYGADVLIWLMPEEATEDLLNALNNFRELFYEVKIPNLVFYNQAFSDRVIKEAPDFWRYRGNYYEFEEVERGMAFEAIETLAAPFSYQDKADLLRRKRISEYLLERVRDKKGKANLLSELGTIWYHLGELDTALNYHEKALGLYEDLGIKEEMAAVLRRIGNVYLTKGALNKALDYYEKVVTLSEELRSKEEMAAVLGNIGSVHRIKGERDNALDYHKKALKLNAELGRKDGMTADYGNIGNVYYDTREFEKASEYYEKALKLNDFKISLGFFLLNTQFFKIFSTRLIYI